MMTEKKIQRIVSSGPVVWLDDHGFRNCLGDDDDLIRWAAVVVAAATDDCVAAAVDDYHRLVGGADLRLSAVGRKAEQGEATDRDH